MLLVEEELEKDYYTTKQAIEQVGISEPMFFKELEKHNIQRYRFRGNKNYYLKSDIEKLKQKWNRIRPVD